MSPEANRVRLILLFLTIALAIVSLILLAEKSATPIEPELTNPPTLAVRPTDASFGTDVAAPATFVVEREFIPTPTPDSEEVSDNNTVVEHEADHSAEIELSFPQAISPSDSETVRVDIAVPLDFQHSELVIVDKLPLNDETPPIVGTLEQYRAYIEVSDVVYVLAVSDDFNPRITFPDPQGEIIQEQAVNLKPGGSASVWTWVITAPDRPKKGILTISVHQFPSRRVLWNRNIEIDVQVPTNSGERQNDSLIERLNRNAELLSVLATVISGLLTAFVTYAWPWIKKRRQSHKARPQTAAQKEQFLAEIAQTHDLAQLNDWQNAAHDPEIQAALQQQIDVLDARQKLLNRDLPDALLSAFDANSFEQMLRMYFDTRLDEITGNDDGMRSAVLDVIAYAELRSQTLQLVRAARAANPDNERLATVAQEIFDYFNAES